MRNIIVVALSLITCACSGSALDTPVAPAASQGGAAEARGGTSLPFRGTFSTTEVPDGPLRRLNGSGQATHLGRFTVTAAFTLIPPPVSTASGTAVWTADNGDQLYTNVSGTATVVFPTANITETHTITGGTGRFEGASGSFVVVRTLDVRTLASTATIEGTINLAR